MSNFQAIALLVFMALQIANNLLTAWRLSRLEKLARAAGLVK